MTEIFVIFSLVFSIVTHFLKLFFRHDEQNIKDLKNSSLDKLMESESTNNIEKDILRYYYYIHNGIDTEHVAPLEDERLRNVLSLISQDLRRNHQQTVVDLSEEMKEDYLLSVKKAIVDFVLKDAREQNSEGLNNTTLEYKAELDVVPKPWHHSFEKARFEISKNLHSINPCMLQVLRLWYTSFE
jgi:dynein heavy chain